MSNIWSWLKSGFSIFARTGKMWLIMMGIIMTVAVIGMGLLWMNCNSTPTVVIRDVPQIQTKIVEVPVDRLTTKIVTQYVTDKTHVNLLLKENEKLSIKVQELSETLANYKVTGVGSVATVDTSTLPASIVPSEPSPVSLEYKDWRLHMVFSGGKAQYQLTQKFEVLTTTGLQGNKPVTIVKLFEVGEQDQRFPIPDTSTTVLFATGKSTVHWQLRSAFQAGLMTGRVVTDKTVTKARQEGVYIGWQWNGRGRTSASDDTRWSLLSPMLFMPSSGKVQVGVVPVAFNMGSLPYVPLHDIWLAPTVSVPINKFTAKYGFALTASF